VTLPSIAESVRRERADDLDELQLRVGERVDFESLTETVVPPHVLLLPFLETPDLIEVEGENDLGEEGVHASVYRLRAKERGEGELIVGFRDFRTREVTHRKAIRIAVE
jgi:hypothetical protein